MITIRVATTTDADALYALGKATPEFQVSAESVFMEPEEFVAAIQNSQGVFLMAEDQGQVAGFVYANRQDIERAPQAPWACMVYLVIAPAFRQQGIAKRLFEECVTKLKRHGVKQIYSWANTEGDGAIISFLEKQGFAKGHQYVWMDREI